MMVSAVPRCGPVVPRGHQARGRVTGAGVLAGGLGFARVPRLRQLRHRRSRGNLEELREKNGLPNLELYVAEDPSLAAWIFQAAGFVLVPGAVSEKCCRELKMACEEEEAKLLQQDPLRRGNRGKGRYSLGEAQRTGHLLHRDEWAALMDLEKVSPVLKHIFGAHGYVCAGAGGDFVLPRIAEYQPLHVDLNFPDCHTRKASPVVTLNVAVEPLTWLNGPTRIIPGTHVTELAELREPQAWRYFTLAPLPAGTAILRDNRAWHGGTPNMSAETRFLPNVEFAATWWCQGSTDHLWRNPWKLAPRCMPYDLWSRLSPFGQHICRLVVTKASLSYGLRDAFLRG
ncbi:unnamed protein product [Effrenium voratum]|uniref:Phytanoyl-CoA dioxygenase family protein n=1 Tax=Effrenium voratum TaxID=2562239 RepID=A0AA36MM32_9DINO|nr:unnamed protein product [Effrenium voratum]